MSFAIVMCVRYYDILDASWITALPKNNWKKYLFYVFIPVSAFTSYCIPQNLHFIMGYKRSTDGNVIPGDFSCEHWYGSLVLPLGSSLPDGPYQGVRVPYQSATDLYELHVEALIGHLPKLFEVPLSWFTRAVSIGQWKSKPWATLAWCTKHWKTHSRDTIPHYRMCVSVIPYNDH